MPDDRKAHFYEEFAEDFDAKMNMYDLDRRIEIVFDELLPEDLTGKKLLDAGSGTGWFSERACKRGAEVTSLDVGEKLLAQVAKKCQSERVVGDILALPFDPASFDFVICSEVIEHTVDPALAVSELARVLRPGGVLIITVPNRVWHFAIDIANLLKLRPYEGYENWLWWPELRRYVERQPLQIERMKGFHMIPFVVPATHGLLRRIDRFGEWLGPVMLNIAVRARKVATPS
jgi:2-polyprenyl-6-hydroxyphenyl methylase/3-demethylubiquinone-9 3-methyltransferase